MLLLHWLCRAKVSISSLVLIPTNRTSLRGCLRGRVSLKHHSRTFGGRSSSGSAAVWTSHIRMSLDWLGNATIGNSSSSTASGTLTVNGTITSNSTLKLQNSTITGTGVNTYTIPAVNSSNFIMSEGTQTINGSKTFSAGTTFSSTIGVTGLSTLTGGAQFATSGGTPSTLNFYQVANASFSLSTGWGTFASYTIRCYRVGDMVTIRFPSSSGTSTSVGTAAGAAGSIPSQFRPPATGFFTQLLIKVIMMMMMISLSRHS